MGIYKGSRRRAVRELVRAENAQTLADADRHVGLLRGSIEFRAAPVHGPF